MMNSALVGIHAIIMEQVSMNVINVLARNLKEKKMFKIGDRVRCVNNISYESEFTLNQEYTIASIELGCDSLQLVKVIGQIQGAVYAHHFILIDEVKAPSKDQILKASESSPQAKEALKVLFPDLFPKQLVLGDLKPGDFFSSTSYPNFTYFVINPNAHWIDKRDKHKDAVLHSTSKGDIQFDFTSLKVIRRNGFDSKGDVKV